MIRIYGIRQELDPIKAELSDVINACMVEPNSSRPGLSRRVQNRRVRPIFSGWWFSHFTLYNHVADT